MGFEVARALLEAGANVHLISGPVNQDIDNQRLKLTKVTSANEMYHACLEIFPHCDIAIMSAAVADFTPVDVANQKIKKEDGYDTIKLKSTKDILSELGKRKKDDQFLVGFALETENEEINAIKKLNNKNLDLIVLNSLKDRGAGFGHDTNKITIISKNGDKLSSKLKSKYEIAKDIVNQIEFYSNQ